MIKIPTIKLLKNQHKDFSTLFVINDLKDLDALNLDPTVLNEAKKVLKEASIFKMVLASNIIMVSKPVGLGYKGFESARKNAAGFTKLCNEKRIEKAQIVGENATYVLASAEGAALANYQFSKYFVNGKQKLNTLMQLEIVCKGVSNDEVTEIQNLVEGVYLT